MSFSGSIPESNPTSHMQNSNLYHLGNHSPLAEVIDRKNGFLLIKNLCPHNSDRYYTVAIEDDCTKLPIMPNPINETWITHSQADEVMRNLLNTITYNKATKDFMNDYEA